MPAPSAPRLTVVADASALSDNRRHAGIGRYVRALLEALEAEAVDVVPVRPPVRPVRESWSVRFVNAQPALALAWWRHGRPVLHAMSSDPALVCPPERQVVTLHDVVPWARLGDAPPGRYLRLQRARLRRTAAVIVPSAHVAAEASRRLGLDAGRIRVIPEGVDPGFGVAPTAEDAAARAWSGDGSYLLWVGSLVAPDPRKALDTLLEAVARLPGAPPLVLAGATGPEAERVRGVAARLGVAVRLTGWVADQRLAALYRNATAAVLPSLEEGFGLPALEALACGCPLVGTDLGPVTDIAGDAAVLVTPGDAAALADGLARVTRDAGLRAKLRQAGPRQAARFTWAATAASTAAVYREVAAGATGGASP